MPSAPERHCASKHTSIQIRGARILTVLLSFVTIHDIERVR